MLENEIKEILRPRVRTLKNSTALITGASSGIGLAMAVRLAQEGCHLNLIARRELRLNEVKAALLKLNPEIRICIYPLDLTDSKAFEVLKSKNAFEAEILINNAGLAKGFSPIIDSKESDWSEMLETNITAAFRVSKETAAMMTKLKGGGDIVAISSVAGHFSYENGAVYCASKHALRAFHEALRLETLSENIRIMMFSPGMVETEFSLVRFNGDHEKAKNVYRGVRALDAGDIADSIVYSLKLPRHINLDEVIIKPQQQGNPWKIHRE